MNRYRSKLAGIWSKSWRIFPWMEFNPGETTLGWGLAFLAVNVALNYFVMGWLLAALMSPLTILLLVGGISKSRLPGRLTGRQWVAAGLWLLGIFTLSLSAYTSASLSYQLAMESKSQAYSAKNLTGFGFVTLAWCGVGSFFSVRFLSSALSFWTHWPPTRIRTWRRIFLAFPFITLLIHQFLAALGGPLTA
jgi:hypothetical protein